MSKSTEIDVNYLSYACDPLGNCAWSLSAGSPYIIQCPAPTDNSTAFVVPNPTSFASILKLADHSSITLTGLVVDQANENSVDINNNVTATVEGVFGNSTPKIGNQIFSVKGNCKVVIKGTLKGAGNRADADVLVDNWSDQDYGPSSVDLTEAKHETGRKLKVVYRIGSSTVIGDCEKLYLQSIGFTAYYYLKLIVRKIMGIPQGKKGPSFL